MSEKDLLFELSKYGFVRFHDCYTSKKQILKECVLKYYYYLTLEDIEELKNIAEKNNFYLDSIYAEIDENGAHFKIVFLRRCSE